MDRLLRQQLDAIAGDRRSGAAELALRAVTGLQSWLRRHPKPTEQELLDIARALLRAQPSMAPLLRLANDVALSIDTKKSAGALSRATADFRYRLQTASRQISRYFVRWLAKGPRRYVLTYSHSSTVATALIRARSRIEEVLCSESRPGYEGIQLAKKLGRAGIKTGLTTDAGLFSQVWPGWLLALGCDAVLNGWVAAKVGSRVLIRRMLSLGGRAVFLVDTTKFWYEPTLRSRLWQWTFGPEEELWKRPPANVQVYNLYFELIEFSPKLRFLTERGWMTPKQVRGYLKNIRISPRLRELAN